MGAKRMIAIVAAAILCASCDDSTPPTAPSTGREPRLTLLAPQPTLGVGESQQLSVVVVEPDGSSHPPNGPVTWRSSNDAVYTMWSSGVAVAIAPGQATITAEADGRRAEVALTADVRPTALRRVQGRLTDFSSGSPMAGVTITFGGDVVAMSMQATTDSSGAFAVDAPVGKLYAALDGQIVADLAIHFGGPAYRGDLLGNGGVCISRYGLVTDALTFQPVAGATVRLGGRSMVTGVDGWYRIDLGCVDDPYGNFNTTFMTVTHPAYREFSRVLGRGIHRVNRIDAELQRP